MPVPALSLAQRLAWRGGVVFLLPVVVLVVALRRARIESGSLRHWSRGRWRLVAGVIAFLVLAQLLSLGSNFARLDLTGDRRNTPSAALREALAAQAGELEADFVRALAADAEGRRVLVGTSRGRVFELGLAE